MNRLQLLLVLCASCIAWIVWDSQQSSTDDALNNEVIQPSSPQQSVATEEDQQLILVPRKKRQLVANLFEVEANKAAKKIPHKNKRPNSKSEPEMAITPLPFVYLGKWQEGDAVTVLVEYQNQVMPIKQGDVLIEQYKVLAIEEAAQATVVTFESLADKTQQQLRGKG